MENGPSHTFHSLIYAPSVKFAWAAAAAVAVTLITLLVNVAVSLLKLCNGPFAVEEIVVGNKSNFSVINQKIDVLTFVKM